MPQLLRETIKVREQYGLALNRLGRGDEAEAVLLDLIAERGASSETLGILGRVYKDRWKRALKEKNTYLADGLLSKAIETYLRGFEADWRDAYPGINAATLMELKEPPDPRRTKLLPLVVYAAERRVAAGSPDYWDYATLLEAHVLKEEEAQARLALGEALARMRSSFGPDTTANNLSLIREAREGRGAQPAWAT